MNYTVDATNKPLGRLATEIAVLLMGKNDASFTRNTISQNLVAVANASKMKIDPRKLETKFYKSFSGHPGGLRELSMTHVAQKKGYAEILTTAVKGMLPDNKLKKEMLKHLTVTE